MGREAVDMCVADKVEGEGMMFAERKLAGIESEMNYCSAQLDEITEKLENGGQFARLNLHGYVLEHKELADKLTCLADEYQRIEQKMFTRWEWLQIAFETFLDWIAPYDEKPKRKPKEWVYIDEDDTLIFQPGIKVKSMSPDRPPGGRISGK